jgi:hypothetical protein
MVLIIFGALLLALGVVMIPLPGPGILVAMLGVVILLVGVVAGRARS